MAAVIEPLLNLENALLERLSNHGFRKMRKGVFVREIDECIQHISIIATKVRGKDLSHIGVHVGFTYDIVNKTISALKSEKYERKWATANIDMATLINLREPYGFYVNDETNIACIADNIFYNIENFALCFLECCDSLNKYYTLLVEKNENVIMSTYALKRPEWNLLALSIILGYDSFETILHDYQEFFRKNNYPISELHKRIESFVNRGEVETS